MQPLNGTKGMNEDAFFRGYGCIPVTISVHFQEGQLVRPGPVKDLEAAIEGFDEKDNRTWGPVIKAVNELKKQNDATHVISSGALPVLLKMLDKGDLEFCFSVSSALAVLMSGKVSKEVAEALAVAGGADVLFPLFKKMRKLSKAVHSTDAMMLSTNTLFILGSMIGAGMGPRILNRGRFGSFVDSLSDPESGIRVNSLFCIRMTILENPEIWADHRSCLPDVLSMLEDEDGDVRKEAGEIAEALIDLRLVHWGEIMKWLPEKDERAECARNIVRQSLIKVMEEARAVEGYA